MNIIDLMQIRLDRENATYYSGEEISGVLVLKPQEQLFVKNLTIQLHGFSKVYWEETETYTEFDEQKTRTNTYENYEEYINKDVVVVSNSRLEPIEYRYSFKFILPITCPSSFEYRRNITRYSVNGTIEIPGVPKKDLIHIINVICPVDLNIINGINRPMTALKSHTFCCGCFKTDPVMINLSIPKSGFVPGEEIPFNVEITNKSERTLRVLVKLVQHIKLFSGSRTNNNTRDVGIPFSSLQRVNPRSNFNWNSTIPVIPVPPSNNRTNRIIDVFYQLALVLQSDGFSFDVYTVLPLVIGTIPLQNEAFYSNNRKF